MNAPLPKQSAPLPPDVQATLDAATAILGGGEVAAKTVRAMYHLGRMDGMLAMAGGHKQIVDAAMRSAL